MTPNPSSAYQVQVCAFDPGETTGFACVDFSQYPPQVYHVAELHGLDDFDAVREYFFRSSVIIIESFNLWASKARLDKGSLVGNEFIPIQRIGTIEYMAHVLQTPVVRQPPSCKQAWDNKTLQGQFGDTFTVPYPGRRLHISDALRHCMYWYWGMKTKK